MVAIEVEFLTGRYSATEHNDRESPEWPPHPARLFSAMVATWADADTPDSDERSALEWLEAQSSPTITCSKAWPRSPVTHFVPVNDASVVSPTWYQRRAEQLDELEDQLDAALEASSGEVDKKVVRLQEKLLKARTVADQVEAPGQTNPRDAAQLLPENRVRQARVFPSVTPAEPRVTYAWDSDPEAEVAATMDRLLERVTRLGHSSSLVSCRIVGERPEPTLVPGRPGHNLRSIRAGQLQALEQAYTEHRGSRPRALPYVGVSYGPPQGGPGTVELPRSNMEGDWLLFTFGPTSRRFPTTRTVDIARVLREAVFHHASDSLSEGLTGHREDGSPTQGPHVSFVPLPYVDAKHADGRIMGAAVMAPRDTDNETKRSLYRAIGAWEESDDPMRLTLGRSGIIEMTRTPRPTLESLQRSLWDADSTTWTTATPIALPTHPGGLSRGSAAARSKAWAKAEEAIAASCTHVGLPQPERIVVSLDPFIPGTPRASAYPAFRQTGRDGAQVARQLVHAWVEFDQPIVGPLLLGAGRYFGLGLMKPHHQEGWT